MSTPGWDPDFEVALRFFRRRWWDEVQDLLEASGEELAFDDLDLDSDLLELENAVSRDRLRRLALLGLSAADERALRALEAPEELGRAFLRLFAVNLAFSLRTDDLLEALVRNARSGPAPRLRAEDLGALLGRARSLLRARELAAGLPAALAAIEASLVPGDWNAIHARVPQDELGGAVERVLEKRGFRSVPWIRARDGERFVVTRRRGGWVTLLGGAVDRELARELSSVVSPVVWAEKKGDAARFVRFERGRVAQEEADPDEVGGALRALGVTAHDLRAPGKPVPLDWAEYAPAGETSPARLRRMTALGLAFVRRRR